MGTKPFIVISALVALVTVGTHAVAHHSFAAHYIPDQRVTVSGTVTKFDYRSPHSLLYVDATAADGTKQSWVVEFGSPLNLNRLGWNANTLKPGDVIVAVGMPSRTGALRMNVVEIRRAADGFEYKARPPTADQTP
jgi:Family of unknown function (DUF6152)